MSALSVRLAGALALTLGPSTALACAVCGGGDANRQAYFDMTIFLSLLPLALIGGMVGTVWFLYRQAERASREAAPEERPTNESV